MRDELGASGEAPRRRRTDAMTLQGGTPFRLMVESVLDYAFFMLNPEGIVSSWNAGAARIKGYRADEIIGKHFSIFYPEEALELGLPAYELAIAAATGRYEDEGWRLRKDGTRLWANVVITAVRSDDGQLVGFAKVTRDLSERKESEEALRTLDEARMRAEEPLRLMVEGVVGYAVFMLDAAGLVTTWNFGAERIKGYAASDVMGRSVSMFYAKEAQALGVPGQELALAATEGRHEVEGWRIRKDGTWLWESVITTALRDSGGELRGFVKVTRDLSERRAAEEAQRELSARNEALAAELASANSYLRNVLNASTLIAVIATDKDGVIRLFSRGAERMLGYRADEVIGKETPALFHDAQEVAARGEQLSALVGRPVTGFEVFTESIGRALFGQLGWTYVHKDGHRLTVLLSLSDVVADDGDAIGFLGVAEDVTERERGARELAAAYARLNSALESMSDSVMTIGHDWTLLYGNRRTLEGLPEFATGENYWKCFPSVIGTPTEEHLRTAMAARTEVRYEILYAPHQVWFRVHVYPTEDGLTAFFRDVTEEKKMLERLELERVLREKRIEALSHMAGGLAHEINNPLAIIHARASDLRSMVQGDEPVPGYEVQAACGSIVNTSDRAIRILRGLRGFAREAGSDPMELASIQHLVEQCVDLQEARLARHDVELRVDLGPEIPALLCRETQIAQIVTNLLNNAFEAISPGTYPGNNGGATGDEQEGRWIAVRAGYTGTNVWLEVEDSGPGTKDPFRTHLMDPFFSSKTSGLGMGVGLSLSRTIAQDHGGNLELVSGMERTCFRLTLPFEAESRLQVLPALASLEPRGNPFHDRRRL